MLTVGLALVIGFVPHSLPSNAPLAVLPIVRASGGRGGPVIVRATVSGRPTLAWLAIDGGESSAFGNPNEVGAPDSVDVKLGDVNLGKLKVVDPAGTSAQKEAGNGIGVHIAFDQLRRYEVGLDLRSGTITLWRDADEAALLRWVAATSAGATSETTGFASEAAGQVVVTMKVANRKLRLSLLSGGGGGYLRADSLTGIASTETPRASPDWTNGKRAVAFSFSGKDSKGWTWFDVGDYPAYKAENLDGALSILWLNSMRVVLDGTRHKLDYSVESMSSQCASWLSQTTGLPLSSDGKDIVWDPSQAPYWSNTEFAAPPPLRARIVKLSGFDVSKIVEAYESGDAKSGEFLSKLADLVAANDGGIGFVPRAVESRLPRARLPNNLADRWRLLRCWRRSAPVLLHDGQSVLMGRLD